MIVPSEFFKEYIVIVEGKRNASWRNNYPLIAFYNGYAWLEERHPESGEIEGVISYMEIPEY